MKTNRLFAFSLPGLAALFVVMPHTRPTELPRVKPAVNVQSVPCSGLGTAQALVSVSPIEGLKSANCSYPYSVEMGSITRSSWVSEDDMIFWSGVQLKTFSRKTQQATAIAGTESAFSGKHWASVVSLSPDSRWLVWASGEDGHSTWEAITLDGTEHRQWPRDESLGTPAVAWMQDSIHWVELRNPETKISAKEWRTQPDNLRARVYSLSTSDIQEFPLHLETPDPAFVSPCTCVSPSEFIFTEDGHAWLTQDWSSASALQGNVRCSREDVYELVPGPTAWTLRKSSIYPVADSERWMFDSSRRSPDGQWIAWCNCAPNSKDKLRLMLSRTDGSEMQEIYQSDSQSGIKPEWSPDSRQIAFTDNGPLGIVTLKIDPLIAQAQPCSPGKAVARALPPGRFPVAHPGSLLAGRPDPSAALSLRP